VTAKRHHFEHLL